MGSEMSGRPKGSEFEVFFEPKSVAIVGASNNPMKFGYYPLRNLLDLGFEGKIYPVNPKYETVQGMRSYRSINDIPEKVDLAVIIVPNVAVPSVVRECAQKRVKGIVIHSSGFREFGAEGERLEEEILGTARTAGIRIVGPNTTGTVNPSKKFTTTFVPMGKLKAGPLSFVAQTGLFAAEIMRWIFTSQKFGIAKVFGLGNKCDVDETEALEYVAEDPDTKVIALYLESVKGREFFEKAKEVSKRKPIVLLKSGRTEAGKKAASSHTGSLAVRDDIFDAACRQAGIIRVNDFDEMLDVAKALIFQPLPRGDRVAVVSMTGGGGVVAVDACAKRGLKVGISARIRETIQPLLPGWARVGNFLDLEPLFEKMGLECYDVALEAVLSDEEVDCVLSVLLSLVPEGFLQRAVNYFKDLLSEKREKYPDKVVVVYPLTDKPSAEMMRDWLEEVGVPVYPSIERCAWVLSVLARTASGLAGI